ncbi:MAG TPA: hypothetical protein VKU36_00245 [Candidatus Babeliales bacterium]|nr:hypothetical protein [Candidatus Babeliales bacterium]
MKYILFVFTFGIFYLHAMNQPAYLDATLLTHIKDPLYIEFLTHKNVIIAGSNGCSIIDSKKNKQIDKITSLAFSYDSLLKLKVHSDKEKVLFFDNQSVIIYDVKSSKKWNYSLQNATIKDVIFNPIDKEVFIFHGTQNNPSNTILQGIQSDHVLIKNYITNAEKRICLKTSFPFYSTAHHPSQPLIINVYNNRIAYFENFECKELTFPIALKHCYFNHDGSRCALQGDSITYIANEKRISDEKEKNEKRIYKLETKEEKIAHCAFHWNENIFITLSTDNIVCYWDIVTSEPLQRQTILSGDFNSHKIACSPDGNYVLIAQEKHCMLIPISEEIKWHNKFFYLFFLLKKCIEENNLPKELIPVIGSNLYDLHQKIASLEYEEIL